MDNKLLIHWGIPGMKWGVRRQKVLRPTFQYRDSRGNLVSRYGKGKYGGGPKPTSKGDDKFYREANKQAMKLKSFINNSNKEKVKDLPSPSKTKKVIKTIVTVYATMVAVNFVADKVLGLTGVYDSL